MHQVCLCRLQPPVHRHMCAMKFDLKLAPAACLPADAALMCEWLFSGQHLEAIEASAGDAGTAVTGAAAAAVT